MTATKKNTYEIKVRDCYEQFTTTYEEKAESVEKAIWQLRQRIIGWGNCHILSVEEYTRLATINHYFFPQFGNFDYQGNLKEVR